jgi:CheY-like chemotaxis protein
VERKLGAHPTSDSPNFKPILSPHSAPLDELRVTEPVHTNDIEIFPIPSTSPLKSTRTLPQFNEFGSFPQEIPKQIENSHTPLSTATSPPIFSHSDSSVVSTTSPPINRSSINSLPTPVDPPAHRMRILVAEDSVPNLKLLLSQLRRLNFEAIGVENGLLALQQFENWDPSHDTAPFDLILMDGNMPVCDGYEATRKLRAMGITIPIIAVTGNAMAEDLDKFRRAGATDILTKPIMQKSLLKTLNQYR